MNNREAFDRTTQSGFTLIELIVAIAISSFVIVLWSQVFSDSLRQYHNRMNDSAYFRDSYLIENTIRTVTKRGIKKCSFGKLILSDDLNLNSKLLTLVPALKDITFECYEKDIQLGIMQEWYLKNKPDLIEYSMRFSDDDTDVQLQSSVLLNRPNIK